MQLSCLCLLALLSAPAASEEIPWHHGTLEEAVADAGQRDRMILVYCWRDGSENCSALFGQTLSNAKVAARVAQDAIGFSAKLGTEAGEAVFQRYHVSELPMLIVLDSKGQAQDSIVGFIPVEDFLGEFDRIARGEGTLGDLRRRQEQASAGSEEELELRWLLAGKMQELGDQEGHDALMKSITESDPEGKTLLGARIALAMVANHMQAECTCAESGEEGAECTCSLEPLYTTVAAIRHPQGRFEGWNQVARVELDRGEVAKGVEALKKAAKDVPAETELWWCHETAAGLMACEGSFSAAERKFVVAQATRAAELAKNRKVYEAMRAKANEEKAPAAEAGAWKFPATYEEFAALHKDTLERARSFARGKAGSTAR